MSDEDLVIDVVTDDCMSEVQSLSSFKPATEDEIRKLVLSSKSKTCSLDVILTFLIKECIEELAPTITALSNSSLQASIIPPTLKYAIITPAVKKPSADCNELSNFKQVFNLPYVSKVLEKAVINRLHEHKIENGLFEPLQSAYHPRHSTETALITVQNNTLRAIDSTDKQCTCVFRMLFDLLTAVDTIANSILLDQMITKCGVVSSAYKWLTSYF